MLSVGVRHRPEQHICEIAQQVPPQHSPPAQKPASPQALVFEVGIPESTGSWDGPSGWGPLPPDRVPSVPLEAPVESNGGGS